VRVSRENCEILFTNLVLNALQHSPANASISVHADAAGKSVLCSIQDFGEGIAPEHLPHLFDRFYRSDRSRSRNTGGTGLGLAICKAIVEGHGGKIAIDSEESRGTRVTVELPAAPAPVPGTQSETPRFQGMKSF
jgi:signal transduction histidine kinase